jgi:hypothetical protein
MEQTICRGCSDTKSVLYDMNDDIRNETTTAQEAKRLAHKIRNRLWARRFRSEHPDARVHEYQKLKADPERYARHLANAKRWRDAHPANAKRWKDAHPDYQRLWRERNPGSTNAARKTYIVAWKATHPERQREYSRRWRMKQDESLRKTNANPGSETRHRTFQTAAQTRIKLPLNPTL